MLDTLIIAALEVTICLCAAGLLVLAVAAALVLSTGQLTVKRWYRNWHRNRLHLRKDRAYQAFAARYQRK